MPCAPISKDVYHLNSGNKRFTNEVQVKKMTKMRVLRGNDIAEGSNLKDELWSVFTGSGYRATNDFYTVFQLSFESRNLNSEEECGPNMSLHPQRTVGQFVL